MRILAVLLIFELGHPMMDQLSLKTTIDDKIIE